MKLTLGKLGKLILGKLGKLTLGKLQKVIIKLKNHPIKFKNQIKSKNHEFSEI